MSPLQTIIRQRRQFSDAIQELPLTQAQCSHRHVGQSNSRYGWPVRICLHCGFEEIGSVYSTGRAWSRREYDGAPKLGNVGRTVQLLSHEDYLKISLTSY